MHSTLEQLPRQTIHPAIHRTERDIRQPVLGSLGMIENAAPDLWDAACGLADTRDWLEMWVVACVLADPANLVAVARGEGVELGMFHADDFAAVWLAAEVAGGMGTAAVIVLAMRLLKQLPFCWDWQLPPLPAGGRSSLWNESRMAWLGTIQWPCRLMTEMYSAKLVEVDGRQSMVQTHLDLARRLLEGGMV
jgi:hypothetical protein